MLFNVFKISFSVSFIFKTFDDAYQTMKQTQVANRRSFFIWILHKKMFWLRQPNTE